MSDSTKPAKQSRGEEAAFGPRKLLLGRIRSKVFAVLRRIEDRTHSGRRLTADHLQIVPAISNQHDLADLSGRLNWYLPETARAVPIHAEINTTASFSADEAWYLHPAFVKDASIQPTHEAAGRRHLVVRKLTPRTALSYAMHFRNATLIDHSIGYGVEDGYYRLHKRFGTTEVPSPQQSLDRLLAKRVDGGTALVLATGPSARLLDPEDAKTDVRVLCNSAVRDYSLIRDLQPDVIAFGDPVFHYGPSKYAAAFRDDLLAALELCDALVLTSQLYVEPLLAHVPEIAERVAVLPLTQTGPWRWPSSSNPTAKITPNVLTNLMLPAAFALADRICIAGCDGRDPSEQYFWKHNTATQYSDGLMKTAFEAHQAFFRDRDYADYYERHCQQLEAFLKEAEMAGKSAIGITPSHIPALTSRGAPAFPKSVSPGALS